MRKIGIVILLVMALALAGCSSKKKSPSAPQTPTATVFSTSTPYPSTWTPTPPGFKASPTNTALPAENPTERPGGSPLPPTWTPGVGPTDTPHENSPEPLNTSIPSTWTPTPSGFVASLTPPGFVASPANPPVQVENPTERPGGGAALPPTWTPGTRPTITPRYTPTELPPTLPLAPTWTAQPEYCSQLQITSPDTRITVGQSVQVSWIPIPQISTYALDVRIPSGDIAYQENVTGSSATLPGSIFTLAGGYSWEVWPLDANGQKICYPASRDIIVSF